MASTSSGNRVMRPVWYQSKLGAARPWPPRALVFRTVHSIHSQQSHIKRRVTHDEA